MFWKNKRIYLDYASATPVLEEATAAMHTAETFVGNPGAIHAEAVAAKKSLEDARATIAAELACKPREIIFTSGLTESNNLAIVGLARGFERAQRIKGTHWIVSAIEHDAVLESFSEVERLGGVVTHINPDEKGIISVASILRAVRPETVLVSVGWVNNEIGVVQHLRNISRAVREKNPKTLIHSDAGQGPLYAAPHVHTLGVDLFSIGSNKLYGPHGVGALYISNAAQIAPIVYGGKQERALRPGTENVALAVGFATAVAVICKERDQERKRLENLRDKFFHDIRVAIPDVVVNGDLEHVASHFLSFSIPNIDAEYVTLALDSRGIAVSTKSACREGEERYSRVVVALDDEKSSVALAKEERARNTIRVSLGRNTTSQDLAKTVLALKQCVDLSRAQKLL